MQVAVLLAVAHKIGVLPVEKRFKVQMARGLILGKALYGVEVDRITQQHITMLRRLMATAIWRDRTVKNRKAVLLLCQTPEVEPEVAIGMRMCKFWCKLAQRGGPSPPRLASTGVKGEVLAAPDPWAGFVTNCVSGDWT